MHSEGGEKLCSFILNLRCSEYLFNYLEKIVIPDICFVKVFLVSTDYFFKNPKLYKFVLSFDLFLRLYWIWQC
jgi:hypothetical protein